ncbi:hypothetical protein D5086_013967 [Populus alba]|uniref:Uncharacterized protein n=2 Tax=Populus alba TaxID=43335 RepID=A0ACC4C6Z3_POPAL|nr:uncharacterized protein LOC118050233 [Populus alba]TKS11844.1 uncharacterized protein D5086_0000068650 [Populus alba]
MPHHRSSSPFPACFRPPTADIHHLPPPTPTPPPNSGNSNLTTCLYQTDLGLFSLTWSSCFLGHSLHLHLHPIDCNSGYCSPVFHSNPLSLSTISFHLNIKPSLFWKKHGSKKFHVINQEANTPTPRIQIFWDFSRAKFGSGHEPQSGFYIAVVVEREMVLLVGDLTKEAFAKTKALKKERAQVLVLRREHVFGNRVYTTRARFGGKNREISIDCSVNNDARLCFCVDNKRVLQIKRLKWKFRGNERIEVDGVPIQVSWDVYNWLFDDINTDHAVFMFRFESNLDHPKEEEEEVQKQEQIEAYGCHHQQQEINEKNNNKDVVLWQQNSSSSTTSFGMSPIEWRKMRKSLMRTAARSSSSSSISMSSASSGGSSSVMEWASSTEESELCGGPIGFSLLVYAWRK